MRKHLTLQGHKTGTAIPVSALRSESGCGIGEFLDLPLLGSWCRAAGIDLIQLLPVNDTGTLSSPYSALSAFALHPIYIRLDELPGFDRVGARVRSFARAHAERDRVSYHEVHSFKLDILRELYDNRTGDDSDLNRWIDANTWVHSYAVYHCLKQTNNQDSWQDWPEFRDVSEEELEGLWSRFGLDARFHAWVQMFLEKQLLDAVASLENLDVYLKGDIPILMNEDSADVWCYRDYFDLTHLAGAPPDMYTRTGQHWGFPTYEWDVLERRDFDWWKKRLERAGLFYHAFRIDHVLGFFRIWSIPAVEETALLGYYRPALDFSLDELEKQGLTSRDVALLTHAGRWHDEMASHFGDRFEHVRGAYFQDSPILGQVCLRTDLSSEKAILGLDDDQDILDYLLDCYRDRTLLRMASGEYAPFWYYDETTWYKSADQTSTERVDALVEKFKERSESVWAANGRRLLSFVQDSTHMLACAEDLGEVPLCVPEVLQELGILGLKVERWEETEEEIGDLVHPSTYPYLSVSTPGVHDTSSVRGWWEEEQTNREAYCTSIGLEDCPTEMTTELAVELVKRNLRSGSAIAVFQIQDLFATETSLRIEDPNDERVNVPGTTNDTNWSYRIPVTLENLLQMDQFAQRIHRLIQKNRGTSVGHTGTN